jgi:hypothetical protein
LSDKSTEREKLGGQGTPEKHQESTPNQTNPNQTNPNPNPNQADPNPACTPHSQAWSRRDDHAGDEVGGLGRGGLLPWSGEGGLECLADSREHLRCDVSGGLEYAEFVVAQRSEFVVSQRGEFVVVGCWDHTRLGTRVPAPNTARLMYPMGTERNTR